jgi:hypothetical protein
MQKNMGKFMQVEGIQILLITLCGHWKSAALKTAEDLTGREPAL